MNRDRAEMTDTERQDIIDAARGHLITDALLDLRQDALDRRADEHLEREGEERRQLLTEHELVMGFVTGVERCQRCGVAAAVLEQRALRGDTACPGRTGR